MSARFWAGEDGGRDGSTERTGLARAGDLHRAAEDVGVDLHQHGIFLGDPAGANDAFDGHAVFLDALDDGAGAERLPNTLNLAAHYIEGESILYQLDAHGICASSGSACTSGSLEPSHVLRALGVPFTAIHGSVRFSFSRYNTAADVDHILAVFPDIVAALRRVSPYWDTKLNRPRDTAPGAEALLRRQADQQAAAKTSQTAGAVHA